MSKRRIMPTKRIMPIRMQKKVIRRILEKLNPDLPDYDLFRNASGEKCYWRDWLNDGASLPENISTLEQEFYHVRWRAPKKVPSIKKEAREWKEELLSKGQFVRYTKEITIRPHKVTAKGKSYDHGRIQLTVNHHWIGHKAKISVTIPRKVSIRSKTRERYYEF